MNSIQNHKHERSQSEILLSEAPLKTLFMSYALPGVIGLLFYGIQTIIDGLIVGNYLGADALAGVNLLLPCYSAIAVIAITLGIGSQTLISIALGEKNYEKAQNSMTTGFLSILLLSIIFTILFLSFSDQIVSLLGADSRLKPYALGYLKGFVAFIPSIAILFYSDYMLKATGHPRYSMIVMSSTVIMNVILSLLFVVVFKQGTFGVSLATGISFSLGAIASSCITFNKRNVITMLSGKFNPKLLWQMLYNGSSEGVSEMAIGISIMVMNLTLMKYAGADGVAAFTAINYVYFVGTTVFLGISDGIIPIISYNHGANQSRRVWGILKIAARTNFVIGIIVFLILQLLGTSLIALFFQGNEENVLSLARQGVRIYAFSFLLNGLNILSASFFTSLADAKRSIIISGLRGFVFILLGLSIFPVWWGIEGIWVTVPFAELTTFLIVVVLVRNLRLRYQFVLP